MDIKRGTILAFYGAHLSGLAHLQIVDSDSGVSTMVPCENGATVRAMESAFGDVIAPGHTVDPAGNHVNQEVYWSMDDYGLAMGVFCPVDEAPPELIEMYEA